MLFRCTILIKVGRLEPSCVAYALMCVEPLQVCGPTCELSIKLNKSQHSFQRELMTLQRKLDTAVEVFMQSIRTAVSEHIANMAAKYQLRRSGTGLTNREAQVYQHLVSGLQNKEIADKLNVETRTVKFHVGNILKKCKVQSRNELR